MLLWSSLWCHPVQAQESLHITAAELLTQEGFGYTAPPYQAKPENLKAVWQAVKLPHVFTQHLIPNAATGPANAVPTVESWYRLQLPTLVKSANPRYLYIPRWKTDGQIAVYGDNRLLYQSHANTFWNGWNIPLWIALDETADAVYPRVILLRIERPRDSGGGLSTVWLGQSKSLIWRYYLRDLLQVQLPYMGSAAFLTAGIFSLLVWFRQRKEHLYLLFFWLSVASFLRTLHYYVGENRLLISDAWFSWLTVNSLFWLIAGVHFFINHLHQRPSPNLNRAVILLTSCLSLLTLPTLMALPSIYRLSPLVYVLLMVMGVTVGVTGFYKSVQEKSRDAQLLSSGCLMGMLLWFHDWLLQRNYIDIEGIYLGPYTNFAAFLLFLSIMFRRYVAAMNEVKLANTHLAQRLAEREAELLKIHVSQRDAAQRQTLLQERQRMMQDMHDGMGSSLRSALLAVENGRLDAALVAEVLKDCIDDLKLAIDAMEPMQTDLLLLLATLRFRLGPRLESAGIALHWEVKNVPPLDWLDPRNALHILRILQEAITNVIKHTHASEIRVTTDVDGDRVVVTLSDNGQGFDVSQQINRSGKGLGNQLRRAEAIGAEILWDSNRAGTRLSLYLPIQRQ